MRGFFRLIIISVIFLSALAARAAITDEAIARITGQLFSEKMSARVEAAIALGQTKDARAITPLLSALDDETLAPWAMIGLSKIGDAAIAPLQEALAAPEAERRAHAALAMSAMGQPDLLFVLADTLDAEKNNQVRTAIATALGAFSQPRACEALVSLLDSVDEATRHAAIISLETISGQDYGDDVAGWKNWWKSQTRFYIVYSWT